VGGRGDREGLGAICPCFLGTSKSACHKLQIENVLRLFAGFYLQIFNFLLSICILNGRRTPSAKFGTIQRAGKIFFLFVKVKTAVKIQENIAKADKSEIQRT